MLGLPNGMRHTNSRSARLRKLHILLAVPTTCRTPATRTPRPDAAHTVQKTPPTIYTYSYNTHTPKFIYIYIYTTRARRTHSASVHTNTHTNSRSHTHKHTHPHYTNNIIYTNTHIHNIYIIRCLIGAIVKSRIVQ